MVYSEILGDETKETAADLWRRAAAFGASIGVSVQAVMTDNCQAPGLVEAGLPGAGGCRL